MIGNATNKNSVYSQLLDLASTSQEFYESTTAPEKRKEKGQVFTPPSVANFMAHLSSRVPARIKILDAGAGIGMLSIAICDRILRLRSARTVEIVLYETDSAVISLLQKNLNHCRSALRQMGHHLSFEIREEDFILANPNAFDQPCLFQTPKQDELFDLAIMNPPYFKIRKGSEYARLMDHIIHGQPNIYALFMAVAAKSLRPKGELVAITPRSFCGGLYFRGFRRWFFKRMALRHVHLFESRRATFRNSNVLQESVITCSIRSTQSRESVGISTSYGGDFAASPPTFQVPSDRIVGNSHDDFIIRIPENPEDARIMKLIESWSGRFTDDGLCVSTGPVVMFRADKFLLDSPNEPDSAPLIAVHNVRPFETVWPVRKNGKPVSFRVCSESITRRLLLPAANYVLLRRFSAKEERRRLTASCHFRRKENGSYVALENHLNYIYHSKRELRNAEVYGIAAIFNSSLIDRYFRSLSGNTQVNATEIRTMHFPAMHTIETVGRAVRKLRQFDLTKIEGIVIKELGVDPSLAHYLAEFQN